MQFQRTKFSTYLHEEITEITSQLTKKKTQKKRHLLLRKYVGCSLVHVKAEKHFIMQITKQTPAISMRKKGKMNRWQHCASKHDRVIL